jgi:hypothetical protein
MKLAQKGIMIAGVAALLGVSATAMAAPPGKADYNFDPAAENASRYSATPYAGYSYGWAHPYSMPSSPGARYAPREPSTYNPGYSDAW